MANRRVVRILAAVAFATLFSFCSSHQEYETEAFSKAAALVDTSQRRDALLEFLKEFPESRKQRDVLAQIFVDTVELGEEEASLKAADAYLQAVPEDGRMSSCNMVAWSLAEQGWALEKAEALASEAVELARQSGSQRLAGILDTHAFVLYKLGKPQKALELQLEALKGNEKDGEMLGRLALYQHDSGQQEEAIQSSLSSLFAEIAEEPLTNLRNWVAEKAINSQDASPLMEEVARVGLETFLEGNDSPKDKSHAARVLAALSVDLNRAEELAREGFDTVDEKTSDLDEASFRIALAEVLQAKGLLDPAFDILKPFEERAPLYFDEFWLTLGRSYLRDGNREKAKEAFVNGLLLRKDPKIVSEMESLSLTAEAIDAEILKKKEELTNFDPGKASASELTGDRVVLAELFTGAECNPCQAADLAFDLLSDYYPRTSLVVLEYHLHIPGADPLSNLHTLARYTEYGGDFGTPTAYINGLDQVVGGGPRFLKKMAFHRFDRFVKRYLAEKSPLTIRAQAGWEGDLAEIDVVIEGAPSSQDLQLYMALVEKSVPYSGGNGIQEHAWVVRSLLSKGKDSGFQPSEGGQITVKGAFSLKAVEKGIQRYLDEFETNPPERYAGFGGWEERPDRLDRENLAIAVWVQDQRTDEVLQSFFQEL